MKATQFLRPGRVVDLIAVVDGRLFSLTTSLKPFTLVPEESGVCMGAVRMSYVSTFTVRPLLEAQLFCAPEIKQPLRPTQSTNSSARFCFSAIHASRGEPWVSQTNYLLLRHGFSNLQ